MAVTESPETQPGSGEPPASGPPRSRARSSWRRGLPWAGRPVAGLTLGPGQVMRIGIPVRLDSACYIKGSWSEDVNFYVKERFLIFTHWVAVPFGNPLLLQEPPFPGGGPEGAICPSR